MKGYFPENVSEYTKEQCDQYLARYPDSLQADAVRERLKVLTGSTGSKPKTPPPPGKVDDSFQAGEDPEPNGFAGWSDFSKALLTIGIIALVIFLYVQNMWVVGSGAAIVGLRSIWNIWDIKSD